MKLGRRHIGEMDRTVTVDPVVINGQATAEPGASITGDKPPLIPPTWWPWIITATALGIAAYFANREEGQEMARPLAAA